MTKEERVINACHRLNAEAYEAQVLESKKPLKEFTPCPIAEELMQVIRKGKHLGQAEADATLTYCTCHGRGITISTLLDYEYDETYKLAHYAGDRKTLYPRLYCDKK